MLVSIQHIRHWTKHNTLLEESIDNGLFFALGRGGRCVPNIARAVRYHRIGMDAASRALADAPPNDDRTWAARADSSGVALTTL
ncbi:hypothetical protein H9L39_14674 [Fusarium oxysporum f. sp. albedinis]|jgi:hypothetical protein|nr:hypothetical protein H9L39_14674 [Fusarium oxysporum f. sp. albedinis]